MKAELVFFAVLAALVATAGTTVRLNPGKTDATADFKAAIETVRADGRALRPSPICRRANAVRVSTFAIPAATSGGRVYNYEVRAVLLADDYERTLVSRRILAPDYHLPAAKVGRPGEVLFAKAELPTGADIRFDAFPIDCLNRARERYSVETRRP
ncbi:MAG: hypothetical protein PHV28_07725 [Kiritimatiellae bacterium]|nr:hypothetical protein [Kiritimatiellia bacterium]